MSNSAQFVSPVPSPTIESPKISPPPPQTGGDPLTAPPPPVSPPPDATTSPDLALATPPAISVPAPLFNSSKNPPPQIASPPPPPQLISSFIPAPVKEPPPAPVRRPPPSITPPSTVSFQPLTPSPPLPSPPPPPPDLPPFVLVPPAVPLPVPVPVQVQVPPPPPLSLSTPGIPNPIISPPTNPSDTPSVAAVQGESPPTQGSSRREPNADTSHSSQAPIATALLVVLVLLCLIYFTVICVKRLRKHWAAKSSGQYRTTENKTAYSNLDSDGGFSYQQLYDVTVGFSAANLIGEGGFAHVYKGALPNGIQVAVKQLKQEKAGEQGLRSEMEIISRIHHRHLVKLLGYCLIEPYRLLVYEFVPNGTLSHHLHGDGLPVLDWQKRMKIAIGSARGLKYLHEDCEPKIVHRDIKSANILLDNSFEPKLADFGFAKLTYDCHSHVSTHVVGTYGYLAPEYATSGKLTFKSDVFSFGVVLLELISGRQAINPSDPEESLVGWAWPLLVEAINNGNFENLVDPKLEGNYVKKEMHQMVNVAAGCVRHSATNRLSMPQVLKALESGCHLSDLCNGVRFGDSTAFDSRQYSIEIENFQKREFGGASVRYHVVK